MTAPLLLLAQLALAQTVVGAADQGALFGRVCADADRDGACGPGEQGLPGVRVVLETGLTVTTDAQGDFHVAGLQSRAPDDLAGGRLLPGRHRVRVDPRDLPAGTSVLPAGQTVELALGGAAQVDFAVQPPATAVALGPGSTPGSGRPDGPAVRWSLGGAVAPGARVEVQGEEVPVGPDGAFTCEVVLRPGRNALSLLVQEPGGRLAFFSWPHDVVQRPGGWLVVPRARERLGQVALPSGGRAGAAAQVDAPPGTRVEVDGAMVVVGRAGTAALALDAAPDGRRRVRLVPADGAPRTARVEAGGGARAFAVALLDVEGTLRTATLEPRLYGRGAGALRASLWGFDVEGELDVRDADLAAALASSGQALVAPRRADAFERAPDLLRTGPEWGDASAAVAPNAPEGLLRLRVSREGLGSVGWGGVRAWLADGEVGRYHRALQGAHLELRGGAVGAVVEGGARGWFAPGTGGGAQGLARRQAHDQLASTGGSVYALSRGSVVEGSEVVRIVYRDRAGGLPLDERHLLRGRDYQLDVAGGRLLLARPLPFFEGGTLLATDAPSAAAQPVLVVDYETLEVGAGDGPLGGGAADVRLGPVRLSAGGAWESAGHWLARARVLAPLGPVTLSAELARSSGAPGGLAWSEDGGLGFLEPDAAAVPGRAGWAVGARARGQGLFGRGGWDLAFRLRTRGYADAQALADDAFHQLSARLEQPLGPLVVSALYDQRGGGEPLAPFEARAKASRLAGLGVGYQAPRWGVRLEGRYASWTDPAEAFGQRVAVGGSARFAATPWLTLVAGHRQRAWADGVGPGASDDTFAHAGVDLRVTDAAMLALRGGWGPGLGAQAWGNVQVRDGQDTWYGGHALDVDGPSTGERRSVSGVRRELPGGGALFVEDVAAHDAQALRVARAVGAAQALPNGLRVGLRYERGERLGGDAVVGLQRDAGGLSVSWEWARVRLFARGEVRRDWRRDDPAAPGLVQAFATGGGEVELPLGLQATARASWLHAADGPRLASRLLEVAVGLAWRSRLASVAAHYALQREWLPPARGAGPERGFHLVSLRPALRLHDRLTVGAGLHLKAGAVEADPELLLSAALNPRVRIWRGLEVGAEAAARTQAVGGGELFAARGEAGYRFEGLFAGLGYTFFGFSGLGLAEGAAGDGSRLYLRVEAAW